MIFSFNGETGCVKQSRSWFRVKDFAVLFFAKFLKVFIFLYKQGLLYDNGVLLKTK